MLKGPCPDIIPPDLPCFLAEVLMSTDRGLIWSRTTEFFRRLGFRHVLYGYSPDSHGATLGSTDDCFILATLGPEQVAEMSRAGYHLESTTFHYALKTPGIAPFSMTCEDCGFAPDWRPSEAAADFFARHGMLTGCSIGFPPERSRGRAVSRRRGERVLECGVRAAATTPQARRADTAPPTPASDHRESPRSDPSRSAKPASRRSSSVACACSPAVAERICDIASVVLATMSAVDEMPLAAWSVSAL